MSDDFVTRLQLQLREAALRQERRGPVARAARWSLPGAAPATAALAVALLALAAMLGALVLRGEPEPARPEVIATYKVAAGLSPLAPGFGSVWTTDPIRGEVLRIDAATRRVVARIPVGGDARVTTGPDAVWAVAGDLLYSGDAGPVRLLRIDPTTNRVVARVRLRTPAGAPFAPLGVQVDGGVVWAVGLDGAFRIDAGRNVADRYIPLSGAAGDPRAVVADGDRLWVLTGRGRLVAYDARTGSAGRAVRVEGASPSYLMSGPPGALLALMGKSRLALLEPATGRVRWRATFGADLGWTLVDGAVLWVQYSGRRPRARQGLPRPRISCESTWRAVAGSVRSSCPSPASPGWPRSATTSGWRPLAAGSSSSGDHRRAQAAVPAAMDSGRRLSRKRRPLPVRLASG